MSQRTASRLSRILAMIPWVIANPGSSVEEVCRRFGYTESDLAQDLNIVFVCGLPGYGPGDLMSAEIVDDEVVIDMAEYFADAPRLAPAEALALLAAGLAITASGQGGGVLEDAVDKLSAVLLPEGSEVIDIDLAAEPELVGRLKSAAAGNEVVAITYTSLSRDETTEREVEPWSVFSSLGNWYMMGYCRLALDQRVFRVDRIKAAAPIGETFTPPAKLPPAEARYVPSVEDVRARIALGPGARWVTEYYPVDIVRDRSEELIVDFSAADPLVAARLLLRLGPDAKLIKGEEVERALAELRQRILDVYRD
ncbi:MAG TPA: WYL domain-containing protein [Acidimicrobiia bacterium]|nr:WYL domain-containing protein [Acidimicrobiia bacterium]